MTVMLQFMNESGISKTQEKNRTRKAILAASGRKIQKWEKRATNSERAYEPANR